MNKLKMYWSILSPLVVAGIMGLSVFLLVGMVLSIPVCLLWNWLMPYLFGLPTMNLFQAFGLSILITLLSPKEVKLKNKRDLKQEDYSNEVENKLEEVLKDLTSQFEA
jgi:membrane protein implicated in regulation of membrane protease activity|tara:strand:- start:244 stop:567 length:324 start_codon:yes stop_codon:yes gene_type:complete